MEASGAPPDLERYFYALENARRMRDSLEPLPGLPYTKEDFDGDMTAIGKRGYLEGSSIGAWERKRHAVMSRIHTAISTEDPAG